MVATLWLPVLQIYGSSMTPTLGESICSKMEQKTREKCSAMIKEATEAVEERWKELSRRLEAFYDAHKGLLELMTSVGNIKFD